VKHVQFIIFTISLKAKETTEVHTMKVGKAILRNQQYGHEAPYDLPTTKSCRKLWNKIKERPQDDFHSA
jgi:hypothetical protein